MVDGPQSKPSPDNQSNGESLHERPTILDYGKPAPRNRLIRVGRSVLRVIAIVAPIYLIVFGISKGGYAYQCKQCGACANDKEVQVWGLGLKYGRVEWEGPVTKFILDGKPCQHSWEMLLGGTQGLTISSSAEGAGTRFQFVFRIEQEKNIDKVLQQRQAADATFRDLLKAALANPEAESSTQLMLSLMSSTSVSP